MSKGDSIQDDGLRRMREMRRRLDQVSPTFCLAKSLQATLHLHNGESLACCKTAPLRIPAAEIESNPSALHNFKSRLEERRSLREGRPIPNCHYCWDIEKISPELISDRARLAVDSWAEPHFDRVRDASADQDIEPTSLELSFSSLCNFKCSYCDPTRSSKWMEEVEELGPYPLSYLHNDPKSFRAQGKAPLPLHQPNPYIEAFWKWWPTLYPQLQVLRITGGEPLLSRDTFRLFDEVSRQPRPELQLAVNSNLGVPRPLIERFADRVEALIERNAIGSFTLYTSIDGWGPAAEYMRFGLRLEEFTANIRYLMERLPKIQLIFMSTFNLLSVSSYSRFLKFVLELKQAYSNPERRQWPAVIVDVNHLEYPRHQSAQLLPVELYPMLESSLAFMRDHHERKTKNGFYDFEIARMERVVEWIKVPQALNEKTRRLADFSRFFEEHDRRRGTDFDRVFPELRFLRTVGLRIRQAGEG